MDQQNIDMRMKNGNIYRKKSDTIRYRNEEWNWTKKEEDLPIRNDSTKILKKTLFFMVNIFPQMLKIMMMLLLLLLLMMMMMMLLL